MTTIAYKDGMLCSDSIATDYGNLQQTSVKKIFKNRDGWLLGFVGDCAAIPDTVEWFNTADLLKDTLSTSGNLNCLLISPKEKVYYLEALGSSSTRPNLMKGKYFSLGSGSGIALGAMYFGANALQAIEAACKFDAFSQKPIQRLFIDDER